MSIKVAFIGAGSITFTRGLFRDILAVPELQDTRFAFTDISRRNLDMVTQLCQKDLRENRLPASLAATTDRRRALDGADYVISCVRIGGLEAFQSDIDIPLKYGVDQCVGDTLCAGGIMYGQRNIAAILDFCRDIRAVAANDVLFLNYANPMVMNTWAALQHGQVNTVGLCHGVIGRSPPDRRGHQTPGQRRPKPGHPKYVNVSPKTWTSSAPASTTRPGTSAPLPGEDWTARLPEGFANHPEYSQTEKVRVDILQRFGYYTTESNGHCSEYLAWYRKRPADIPKWIDMSSWINGETGGLPPGQQGRPALVPDRFSQMAQGEGRADHGRNRGTSTAATSSRRAKPGGSTAATSTWSTTAASPTCPTTRSSRCRAMWTATG